MTNDLTDKAVWFNASGAWAHGCVLQDDENSRSLPVIIIGDDGRPCVQIVPFGELRFRRPKAAHQ